jgi:hypothetical protein
MVKTNDTSAWTVPLKEVHIAKQQLNLSDTQSTFVLVEPMVPYIYLPEDDFMKYETMLQQSYPFQVTCDF